MLAVCWVLPEALGVPTLNTIFPEAPVPVPSEPVCVQSCPATFVPVAPWTVSVCATGEAESAAPSCRVAAARRVRYKSAAAPSVPHDLAYPGPNCEPYVGENKRKLEDPSLTR